MKLSYLSFLLLTFILIGCSKDEPVIKEPEVEQKQDPQPDAEEEEETTPETYFELNVAIGYHASIFKEGYVVIHNSNGDLLNFMEYGDGSQLKFEATEAMVVTDKLTITQVVHSELGGGDDFYSIFTFPEITKGTVWNLERGESTFNPDGEFKVRINDVPGWKFYTVSNKDGHGPSGSSYYKWLNNPEDAEPFIDSSPDWFPENDFLVSLIDGNQEMKYVDLSNVAQNDSIVLKSEDFQEYDNYLTIDMPDYERFGAKVQGFDSNQDFSQFGGLRVSSSVDYAYDDKTSEIVLGYLSRFSKFRTSINIEEEGYEYSKSSYGERPSSIIIPEKGTMTISNDDLYNFSFDTNLSFVRQLSTWAIPFSVNLSGANNSTTWRVYSGQEIEPTVYALPDEIIARYTNINLESLKHKGTELFIQGDSYQDFMERRLGITKIQNGYIEEVMLFGEKF